MSKVFNKYKLCEITNILAGGDLPDSFSSEITNLLTIPVFSNGEKNNGLYGYTDKPKVTEPAVTISARGSKVGFAAVRKQPFLPIVRLLSLIPYPDKLDVDFLYYNLKLNRQSGIGSGQPQITIPDISNRTISVPPLHTQQKIASVLSSLDSKIELNNRINTELEAMAKTLYDYWFVQFDFPYVTSSGVEKPYKTSGGKMVWNEELKRDIPDSWEVKKVKDIAETGSGGTPLKSKKEYFENGTIPWINSGEVNASFIISSRKFITQKGLDNSSAKLFQRGTILMAMYGATAGQVSLIDLEASTNQAVCGIIPNDKRMIPYLKYGLHQLYDYLINLSSGSARDNLSQDKIKELYFVIPEDKLIAKFYKISNSHFEMILRNLKENQELASLRDWLLPMLMNGQVRVGDVEEELGMVAEESACYGK